MKRAAVAFAACAAALLPAAGHGASQAKLQVSMTDQSQDDPVVVVAGKDVTLIGQPFIFLTDPPCERDTIGAGAVFHARLTLPLEVTLRDGASSSQDATLAPDQKVLLFRWPATAPKAGVYAGRLDIDVQTKGGVMCAGTHEFKIVALTGRPQFAVAPGFVNDKYVTVPLLQQLPRLPNDQTLPENSNAGATKELHRSTPFGLGRALDDAFTFFAGRRRLREQVASTIDDNPQLTCVDYKRPAGFTHGRLKYRFRFDWNQEQGFGTVVHTGHVRIGRRATSGLQKICKRLSL